MSDLRCAHAYLWSDSQIVLRWLSSETTNLIFINNRVKGIKTLTGNYQWRYCPTQANPADFLSRGVSYDKFKDNRLWMQGHVWLTDDKIWLICTAKDRTSTPTDEPVEPQISSATIASITANDKKPRVTDPEGFNSYKKLLRITAYVLQVISKCRHQKETGSLFTTETDAAILE